MKIICYQLKAININPKYIDAYFNLGSIYFQFGNTFEGKVNKAIDCFEKIISINRSYLKAYNKLSIIMRHLNRQDEAINILEKALEIDADDLETLNNIGSTYTELGKNAISTGIDMIRVGDDVGAQQSMMISPVQWRELAKPRFEYMFSEFRKENPDILIKFHSCGDYSPILNTVKYLII